ncbi:MAG: RNA-guided endonuclease InsQ/TnpB family protein [Candidatus Dormibacteria bacterium]
MVKRAYKYRFYPTPQQEDLLNRTFGSVRYVYNRALAERSRAWTQEQRRVGFAETCRMLTTWKQDPDTAWLYEVSNVTLQQGLQHLQHAYVAFWGKRARYPSFKRKHKSQASATFTRMGFSWRDGRITLAKCVDPLSIVWSRPLPDGADPSSVTVSRDAANRWHISILCEDTVSDGPPTDSTVGIDVGITSLVTLSTGEKVTNPKHEKRDRERLAFVQHRLARKAKGSNNRAKARVVVAKVYARITDRRKATLHELSTRIIRENQTVIIEDLSVRNMVRNHCLARAISDASWSELRRQLEYKAAWYGRTVVAVDRFYPSSKTCSVCGAIIEKLPLNVREWVCRCGVTHDRDVNAARNIEAAGLAVLACGDGVRPTREASRAGNRR